MFLLCGRRRRGGRGAHLLRVATNTLLSVSVTRCTGTAVVSVVRARRILSLLLVCWHPRGQILTLLLLPLHVTLTDVPSLANPTRIRRSGFTRRYSALLDASS